MNGATALHTRAPCDECGEMPATREGPGGTVICDACGAVKPANDEAAIPSDALGSLLSGMLDMRPKCLRCRTKPALLRLAAGVFCSECSSFAAIPGESVTAAEKRAPAPAAVVTTISRDGASRSPTITTGDCLGTELTAPRQNTLEPIEDLSNGGRVTGDCSAISCGVNRVTGGREALSESNAGLETGVTGGESAAQISRYPEPADNIDPDQNVTGGVLIPSMVAEQSGELKAGEMPSAITRVASSPVLRVAVEPAAVEVGCGQAPESLSSSCGFAESGRDCKPGATGSEASAVDGINRAGDSSECGRYARAGVTTGPQDSILADPGPCGLNFDAEVCALEAEWRRAAVTSSSLIRNAKKASTSRTFAASDSAENSKSVSESRA